MSTMRSTLAERSSTMKGYSQQLGAVAAGLGVLGLASFAFVSLSGRALGPRAFAPLGTLWVLINAAGPALFQPLEQELGRGISHARELGHGARPLFIRGMLLAVGAVGVVGLCLVLAARPLADHVFQGRTLFVLALFVGLLGLASEHTSRGAFAGEGRFGRYGTQLGLDGFLRLAGCVALVVLGASAGWYAAVLCVAPVAAVLLTARKLGPAVQPGPPETLGRVAGALILLTGSSALSQVVINAPAVVANVLAGPHEQARAGVFISVFVLARVPLFLFAAVQATFLPGLAALVARDDRTAFLQRVKRIVAGLVGLGGLGFVVVVAAGPWLVRIVYGARFATSRETLWPLAAGAGLFMAGAALSQALISARSYTSSLVGWLLGTAVFAGLLALPLRLELRIGLAFFAGTAAAAAALGAGLALRVRRSLSPVAPLAAEERA